MYFYFLLLLMSFFIVVKTSRYVYMTFLFCKLRLALFSICDIEYFPVLSQGCRIGAQEPAADRHRSH